MLFEGDQTRELDFRNQHGVLTMGCHVCMKSILCGYLMKSLESKIHIKLIPIKMRTEQSRKKFFPTA